MRRSPIVDEVWSLLYEGLNRRYLQDSPVLRDVWLKYADRLGPDAPADAMRGRVELLLAPYRGHTAAQLATALLDRLEAYWRSRLWRASRRAPGRLSLMHNESYVAVTLHFDELICAALPLTPWWRQWIADLVAMPKGQLESRIKKEIEKSETAAPSIRSRDEQVLARLAKVVGMLESLRRQPVKSREAHVPPAAVRARMVADLLKATPPASVGVSRGAESRAARSRDALPTPLWSVTEDRKAKTAIHRSVPTTKADAVRNLFNISCAKIRWAVLDTGIDAKHVAFRVRDAAGNPVNRNPFAGGQNHTRIAATYDFTRLKSLFDVPGSLNRAKAKDLRTALHSGRMVDWNELAVRLRVPHSSREYPPVDQMNPHGTHVAGIIGANWPASDTDDPMIGMCPDIWLYDLRVLNDAGEGDEFSILGALQFVRHLNSTSDSPVIHGVNLSMSLARDSENYACGRTPICEECNRLTASGVTVVAAAGNEGCIVYNARHGTNLVEVEGFQLSSITDPGNADSVITVGSTHRFEPHTYGVSFFSSRGPTGDGRQKPDLLAPGEKIVSTAPGGVSLRLDGTSMAAPHVSGAAALLMAKYPELMGQSAMVKQVLCRTATDLGRHNWMQGAGSLDVLRAMQSV